MLVRCNTLTSRSLAFCLAVRSLEPKRLPSHTSPCHRFDPVQRLSGQLRICKTARSLVCAAEMALVDRPKVGLGD